MSQYPKLAMPELEHRAAVSAIVSAGATRPGAGHSRYYRNGSFGFHLPVPERILTVHFHEEKK